ncbi:catalase KatX [Bacillus subtilis]|uniref:catalase KatX n=1 Tax=Bacillus subtilis TaxID=1423 RepID=UPI000F48A894|nr:catalase KatX [Bacillus subtilis]MCL6428138.1 catalase KatX [Bacillus subtilis]ROT26195.1 catalase [Bacillus subtilis]
MKDDHQNKQHRSNAQGSEETLSHKTSGKNESEDTLTNRQGHPVTDNQNVRTVGNRGPTTLENYDFLEKISHFDRERIPERVVHARGAGAHGYFEAYGSFGDEPISIYTRAKLFQEKGKKTPAFVRFSTVNHGKHSPETLRDPRGFAVKLYTEDGNWDLVGNNLKIFFIRDPLKFPDLVHAFQPDPVTNIQDGERIFDFISQSPEATHMITFLFSPWGIPANYRQMQGSGVHAYKWVNEEGKAVLVKYHFEPKQGIRNLTQKEAEEIQGKNFNHATQDLYDAIENGDYPEWEVYAQIMSDDEHPELDFDPLDPTKLWYKDDFPWKPIGKLVLNKNPENYHAEVEQASFGTGVLVDGLDFSDDKLLQGRTFAYSDTQRYRVGANYLQLPINSPKKHVATNQEGGQMQYRVDRAEGQNPHVNYEPSIMGGLKEAKQDGKDHTPHVEGDVKREAIDRTNNFGQAGETYRRFTEFERNELITNLVNTLSTCRKEIQDQMIENFTKADPDYGKRVAEGLKKVSENNSNGPIGTTETEQAAKQAEQESHPSDPY